MAATPEYAPFAGDRLGKTPDVPILIDDSDEEAIATASPVMSIKREGPYLSDEDETFESEEVANGTQLDPTYPPRPSLFSSAGRWLVRGASSLGVMFSPARPDFALPDANTGGPQEERSNRDAAADSRPQTTPKRLKSKQLSRPSSPTTSLRGKGKSPQRSGSIIITPEPLQAADEGEEDDELILSPETAQKRKREEDGEILLAEVLRSAAAPSSQESGRFAGELRSAASPSMLIRQMRLMMPGHLRSLRPGDQHNKAGF